MKQLFVASLLLTTLSSCTGTKYSTGDCLRASDGYYWYISSIEGSNYIAMGWQGNSWGNPVAMPQNVLDVHQNVTCPVRK